MELPQSDKLVCTTLHSDDSGGVPLLHPLLNLFGRVVAMTHTGDSGGVPPPTLPAEFAGEGGHHDAHGRGPRVGLLDFGVLDLPLP